MDFNPVSPDRIKFEVVPTDGASAGAQEQHKTGGFRRFLSGLFKFVTAPLSVLGAVFPPAGLAAMGTYAGATALDISTAKSAAKQAQQSAPAQQMSYLPGMDVGGGGGGGSAQAETTSAPTAMQQRVVDVLYARNDAMMDSTAAFKSGKEVAGV